MATIWNEIKNQLKFYEDRVFFLPVEESYLRKLENQLDVKFPKIYFEFLKEFGFTQDFVPEINQTEDSLLDDLNDFIKLYPGFFLISIHEETDEVWLIKRDSSDDTIFVVPDVDDSDIVPKSKGFTFKELIIRSLEKLKQKYHSRTKNINKVRIGEFRIATDDFNDIIKLINTKLSTRWLDHRWRDKYKPNIFDIEVAFFEIEGEKIIVEKEDDDDGIAYSFEIEEYVTELKNLNKFQTIKDIFDSNDVDFEFIENRIFEIED